MPVGSLGIAPGSAGRVCRTQLLMGVIDARPACRQRQTPSAGQDARAENWCLTRRSTRSRRLPIRHLASASVLALLSRSARSPAHIVIRQKCRWASRCFRYGDDDPSPGADIGIMSVDRRAGPQWKRSSSTRDHLSGEGPQHPVVVASRQHLTLLMRLRAAVCAGSPVALRDRGRTYCARWTRVLRLEPRDQRGHRQLPATKSVAISPPRSWCWNTPAMPPRSRWRLHCVLHLRVYPGATASAGLIATPLAALSTRHFGG